MKKGYLIWDKSETEQVRFLLRHRETLIGRDAACCQIVLTDPRVSRRHGCFIKVGSIYLYKDLGSRNGTHLNGERVTETPLTDGDTLEFGKLRLVFHLDETGDPHPTEQLKRTVSKSTKSVSSRKK